MPTSLCAKLPKFGILSTLYLSFSCLAPCVISADSAESPSATEIEKTNETEFSAKQLALEALHSPQAPGQFNIPFEKLKGSALNNLPIGVFDSGVGGLTVLETILSLDSYNNDTAQPGADGRPDFENEQFIYFGDQANMPYGNYSSQGDTHFLRELIVRDAMFLLGTKSWPGKSNETPTFDKPPVKAIVIACNTATAFGLTDIREAMETWQLDIPVIGVVEAGANALVQQLPARGEKQTIAVMATVGTCNSNAYPKAVSKAAGLAGKRVPVVIQQGSVGLAGAIEGNPSFIRTSKDGSELAGVYQGPSLTNPTAPIQSSLKAAYAFNESGLVKMPAKENESDSIQLNSVENYVRYDVVEMVHRYGEANGDTPISKVILGCTHFPFEAAAIRQELARLKSFEKSDGSRPYDRLIADEVEMIDPAELTAKELYRTLFAKRMRALPTAALKSSDSESLSVSKSQAGVPPRVSGFYFSVANPSLSSELDANGNLTNDYKYGRKPYWENKEDTIPVPLQKGDMPPALAQLLSEKCQHVWKQLDN